MSENIIAVTDQSFEQDVVKSAIPVIVDFWAAWCGPCRALAPILEEVAKEYASKVKIAKVDVDANPNIPTQFGIRGIPTLILFKGGEVVTKHTGLLSKSQLAALIDSHL